MEDLTGTGNRTIMERKTNSETLWKSTSANGRWTKFSTIRSVDGNPHKISLAAYLPQNQEDSFTPARIKYASISSFRERVLSDAEDVACGLRMEIHSLLGLTFGDSAGSLNKFFGRTR
jgi:hypothetical protein